MDLLVRYGRFELPLDPLRTVTNDVARALGRAGADPLPGPCAPGSAIAPTSRLQVPIAGSVETCPGVATEAINATAPRNAIISDRDECSSPMDVRRLRPTTSLK